jgi:hypothetical protein
MVGNNEWNRIKSCFFLDIYDNGVLQTRINPALSLSGLQSLVLSEVQPC